MANRHITILRMWLLLVLAGASAPALRAQEWVAGPSLSSPRAFCASVLLQNGSVLIIGGETGSGTSVTTCELFDPLKGTLRAAAPMITQRSWCSPVLLRDGRVLVVGGLRNQTPIKLCEIYDPASDTWSATADLNQARYKNTITLLGDGRVMVSGGLSTASATSYTQSVEIYDPATGAWTTVAPLPWPRAHQVSTLLPDGRVLVAGGYPYDYASALYDVAGDTWTANSTSNGPLSFPTGEASLTLLPNGKALYVGGWGGSEGMSVKCALFDPATERWTSTGSISVRRSGHRAILLPNGKVMIIGGHTNTGNADKNCTSVESCEIYDPTLGSWSIGPSLPQQMSYFCATLLPSGEIFLAGGGEREIGFTVKNYLSGTYLLSRRALGWTPSGNCSSSHAEGALTQLADGRLIISGGSGDCRGLTQTQSTELYDPATGTWRSVAGLARARSRHTMTLLTGGRILAVGGRYGNSPIDRCELFDPALERWSPARTLPAHRALHTATLLFDGRVLISGGYADGNTDVTDALQLGPATYLFTPNADSGSWEPASPLKTPRCGHTATLLQDGRVLVTGGWNRGSLASSEIFDPACEVWSAAAPIPVGRAFHSATLLPNGKVLVVGGTGTAGDLNDAFLYDPTTNVWKSAGTIVDGRHGHSAMLLANGTVAIIGGESTIGTPPLSMEIFDPRSGTWWRASAPRSIRKQATALLPDESILVAGGLTDDASGCLAPLGTLILGPELAADAWRPTIGALSTSLVGSERTYSIPIGITGLRYIDDARGGTAASTGDYVGGAANYPVVHLRRIGDGANDVLTAVSFDIGAHWSSTGTQIRLPLGAPRNRPLPEGTYLVVVSVNGMSSQGTYLTIDYPDEPFVATATLAPVDSSCSDYSFVASATCLIGNVMLDPSSTNVMLEFTPELPAANPRIKVRLIDPVRRGSYTVRVNNAVISGTLTGEFDVAGRSSLVGGISAQLKIHSPGCDSVVLTNRSDRVLEIPAASLATNSAFSLEPGQFPITLQPGEERGVVICFGAGLPRAYSDSLILATACAPVIVPLIARGSDTVYFGTDNCGSLMRASYVDSDYLIKVSAPRPNPAGEKTELEIHTSYVPSAALAAPICRLVDLKGTVVATAVYTEISRQQIEARLDTKGIFSIDVSQVPAGLYFVTIFSANGSLSFPLQVLH